MKDVLNTVSAVGALVMALTPFVGLAGAAHAETTGYVAQHIQTSDLDLSQAGDRARFGGRVDVVAQRMCVSRDMNVRSACRDAVREEADAQLGQARSANEFARR